MINKIEKIHKINFINLLLNIMLAIGMVFLIMSFTGCASKPQTVVVTKYKYIEKPVPKLKVYQGCDVDLSVTAYNQNGKTCIKEWGGCLDKKAFLKLAKYIITLKSTCKQYENEIIEYNRRFADNNNSK